jgi:RNA polymerase sigma-70 factor, ECF subfamily
VNAPTEAASEMKACEAKLDLETIFRAQYERIARVIARVTGDPARAEELAVEVFLKFWRTPRAHGEKAVGWLYRTGVRKGLDELRHHTRRTRCERLLAFVGAAPTPEEICAATEEREKVRRSLAAVEPRQAELLLLRSNGLSYAELASALDLNPASVGTLLARAQHAFRKEYIKRHGNQS